MEVQDICNQLLSNPRFISSLQEKLNHSLPTNQRALEHLIQEIYAILTELLQHKMDLLRKQVIEDNNRMLEEVRLSLDSREILGEVDKGGSGCEGLFEDVHNLIGQQKRKAFERMSDAQLEKSISIMERYEDVVEKVQGISKKVKSMEDRYQTNFKSLWNVLSMTEEAVFEHIRLNKMNHSTSSLPKEKEKDKSFIDIFWK